MMFLFSALIGMSQPSFAAEGLPNLAETIAASGALDDALRDWISNLFTVWMTETDHEHAGQPERALSGSAKAIAAYHFARNVIGLPTAPTDHIKGIAIEALDMAFRKYLSKLFNAWMHDTGGRPNPAYQRRLEHAAKAYLFGRQAIDEAYR